MWGRIQCPRCRRNVSSEQLYCPVCGTNLHSAYRPSLLVVRDKRMGQSYEENKMTVGRFFSETMVELLIGVAVIAAILFIVSMFV